MQVCPYVVHQDVNGTPNRCFCWHLMSFMDPELTTERSNYQSIAWPKQILCLAAQGEIVIDDAKCREHLLMLKY
jgi:hypothetical protein